jgi:hypothetical protein
MLSLTSLSHSIQQGKYSILKCTAYLKIKTNVTLGFTPLSHSRLKWAVPKMIKCNSTRGDHTGGVRVMQLSLTCRKEHQGVLKNMFIKCQARLTFE